VFSLDGMVLIRTPSRLILVTSKRIEAVHGAIRTTSALQRLAKQGDSEVIGEALVAKGTRVEPLVASLREVL
jgi:hypothetical protein